LAETGKAQDVAVAEVSCEVAQLLERTLRPDDVSRVQGAQSHRDQQEPLGLRGLALPVREALRASEPAASACSAAGIRELDAEPCGASGGSCAVILLEIGLVSPSERVDPIGFKPEEERRGRRPLQVSCR
jgi:hypothetical protein